MAVYVDNAQIPWGRGRWSHMTADTIDELHMFAQKIGMRREWFQDKAHHPHYDVTMSRRKIALEAGAISLDRKAYVYKVREIRKVREVREAILK